jgi:hypothetical protein
MAKRAQPEASQESRKIPFAERPADPFALRALRTARPAIAGTPIARDAGIPCRRVARFVISRRTLRAGSFGIRWSSLRVVREFPPGSGDG